MVPNTELTLALIEEEVKYRLGFSTVCVEVTSTDFAKAIAEAVRLWNRYKGIRVWQKVTVSYTTKKIAISVPSQLLDGIVDVQFVRYNRELTPDPFDPLIDRGHTETLTLGGDTYGSLMQRIQYAEMARNVISAEPEWHAQWEMDGVYYLYVDITQTSDIYWCSVELKLKVTPDDDATTGMQWIDDNDSDWIMDYVEARISVIVGRVRRKHGGIPSPDGGTDSMDGDTLVSEGTEALRTLKEELQKRRRPLPPVIG